MRFCIAGKNNIAVSILQYLLENKKIQKDDLCIICNKTETGKNGWQRSLRLYAQNNEIREETLEEQYEKDGLIFLSLEYDRIINPFLFRSRQLYHIHFSKLPAYKGMYTSALPILNHEKESGVTFHKIDRGIDTGDIVAQSTFLLDAEETALGLYLKYIKAGTELLRRMVDGLCSERGLPEAVPQSFTDSSYYSRETIDYHNLVIDLNQTAEKVLAQIRAFHFREYQLPSVYGKKINSANITNVRSCERPGTIIWKDKDRMVLSTIDYNITLYFDRFYDVLSACEHGNLSNLEKVPRINTYVNQQEEHGWTPLMVATYNGHYDIVQFLLSEGANLSLKNWNGTNLLMYAKEAYVKTGDDRLFKLFLNSGIPLDEVDYAGKNLINYCQESGVEKIGSVLIK